MSRCVRIPRHSTCFTRTLKTCSRRSLLLLQHVPLGRLTQDEGRRGVGEETFAQVFGSRKIVPTLGPGLVGGLESFGSCVEVGCGEGGGYGGGDDVW